MTAEPAGNGLDCGRARQDSSCISAADRSATICDIWPRTAVAASDRRANAGNPGEAARRESRAARSARAASASPPGSPIVRAVVRKSRRRSQSSLPLSLSAMRSPRHAVAAPCGRRAMRSPRHAVAGKTGNDAGRDGAVKRRQPNRRKCSRPRVGRPGKCDILQVHVAVGDEPGEDRATEQDVESGRRPLATRSLVLSYLAGAGRSRTEQKSSSAGRRRSSAPRRMSKRSTSNAGDMPSGISINAADGTSKPRARPIPRQSHSTTGIVSKPAVPAGLRTWVNARPWAGSRLIGALIWTPDRRGVPGCEQSLARWRRSLFPRPTGRVTQPRRSVLSRSGIPRRSSPGPGRR